MSKSNEFLKRVALCLIFAFGGIAISKDGGISMAGGIILMVIGQFFLGAFWELKK